MNLTETEAFVDNLRNTFDKLAVNITIIYILLDLIRILQFRPSPPLMGSHSVVD